MLSALQPAIEMEIKRAICILLNRSVKQSQKLGLGGRVGGVSESGKDAERESQRGGQMESRGKASGPANFKPRLRHAAFAFRLG
jgi:hypothetical protein